MKVELHSLLENLSVGVVVHDPSTAILFANQMAANLLGISREEMKGKFATDPRWKFIGENEAPLSIKDFPVNRVCISKKEFKNQLLGIMRPDMDHPTWVLCNAYPEFNQNNELSQIVVNFIDITERHQLEKELIKAREISENATLLKSHFLDVAAHELRTPVTAFSLLLQLTQRNLENGIPVDSKTLSRLSAQSERISKLVIDLLDVSRLEHGIVKIKPEATDLVELITECMDDFKLRAGNRSIEFSKKEASLIIKIDRVRIFQVISNLLDNAIKYTPESTPIEISLEIKQKWCAFQ